MQAENKDFNGASPKHLTIREVNDPITVLSDFFNDDWLPEQLSQLERWRNFVLDDRYYTDQKGNPGGLLTFYELNLRLIEALWVLSQRPDSITAVDGNTIEAERLAWHDYPVNLSADELSNPISVAFAFFEAFKLPEYREQLHEWLEHGLSTCKSEGWINSADLIKVYENLLKLYSAAWLIYQRNTPNPFLRAEPNNKAKILHDNSAVNIYKLNSSIPSIYKNLLSELISIIKHKVPSVQCVMYIGVSESLSNKIFLLVLTGNQERHLAQSLWAIIEDSCRAVAEVVALVHHVNELNTALANDNLFFNRVLNNPAIYLSGELLLPLEKPFNQHHADDTAAFNWNRWQKQGNDFLNGADYYLKQGAVNAALFSLHQCVECLLIAVIRGVLGYRINNHNLSRMLAITEMFTGDLVSAFDLRNEARKKQFDELKGAYINVRYRDSYEGKKDDAEAMYSTVKHFVLITEKVYDRHVLSAGL